jgi:hypothetical protein
MKITNEQIYSLYTDSRLDSKGKVKAPFLQELLNQKYDGNVFYPLSKFIELTKQRAQTIEETKNSIIKTYGSPVLDAEGKETGKMSCNFNNCPEALKEINALMSDEFEIDLKLPIIINISKKVNENFSIEGNDGLFYKWFIEVKTND